RKARDVLVCPDVRGQRAVQARLDPRRLGPLGVVRRVPRAAFIHEGTVKLDGDLSMKVHGDRAGVYIIDGDLVVSWLLEYAARWMFAPLRDGEPARGERRARGPGAALDRQEPHRRRLRHRRDERREDHRGQRGPPFELSQARAPSEETSDGGVARLPAG